MAALAGALPKIGAQAADKENAGRKLRWCIVGLGRISMDHFMPAVELSKTGKDHSPGERPIARRRRKQAAMYNVPSPSIYSYDNYDEIRQNKGN